MTTLASISSRVDLIKLSGEEIAELCSDIRSRIISLCAENGGHLASNLGTVELTVALHRMFDLTADRLIFDVGHQCYTHKLLSDRRESMETLRKFGGISGFPKPSESVYDAFPAGHASTSVSAALGFARARTLQKQNHKVIAVLGDGALTGGLTYEALCDAGDSNEPLIIILNDNGMSITKNVGGMARYLNRQRAKPSYLAFKRKYRRLSKIPVIRLFYRLTHAVKRLVKLMLLNRNMFEEMGFEYLGAIDGHDITQLERAITWAAEAGKPAIIHILTKKGKGYTPAEESPEDFHGVPPFDAHSGKLPAGGMTFSKVFGEEMINLASADDKIVAITAAMTSGTGLSDFQKKYPERIFDVGIAEGHGATMAAALAAGGLLPVFAVYSTFLQRSYDMLIHDIALSGKKVILAVDRVGIVPGDGETHQGIFDIPFLYTVPNMEIISPSNYAEMREAMHYAVSEDCKNSIAIRYPKGLEGRYKEGGLQPKILREGRDVTIAVFGIMTNEAEAAAAALSVSGIECEIIETPVLFPMEFDEIIASLKKTGRLAVIEDSTAHGGYGERLTAEIVRAMQSGNLRLPQILLLNTGSCPLPAGSVDELRRLAGIGIEGICGAITAFINEEKA